ncbi:zonular occludens toxin family protein [Oceanobacter mangrovi]|uniref:zonular occludens toxin family protein n=1 Tax=Oceanobacter mangrovi TaxID=2862510 RepID=UPI001C8EDABE|nr:zonular occludens toxin domain-containing protein [Oceanobacter mangrovi]
MTAVIHHGPPGSYKTFALIQRVIVPALLKGRTVCHNIRGLDSVPRIAKAMGLEFPPEAKLMAVKHDSEEGFRHMAAFFQWAPMGALIVMDEGQRVYPTRLRSLGEFDTPEDEKEVLESGIQRPFNVENAFDQHRHMNWDIYISTTNVTKIHKEVRAVVEYAYRHRDLSGVLPWYKNKWIEFKHDAEASGKSSSHCIGRPVQYSADQRVFNCYQSTATGKAKKSNEGKSIFADNRVRLLLLVGSVAIVFFFSMLGSAIERFSPDKPVTPAPPGQSIGTTDHHDNSRPGHQTGPETVSGLTEGQLRAEFRRKNPYFNDPDVYDLPPSKEYWLSGVIEGSKEVAIVSDVWRTYVLPLKRACFKDRVTDEWICYFKGQTVASYTGPINRGNREESTQNSDTEDKPLLQTAVQM